MEAMIDAASGSRQTLAGLQEVQAIGRAIDDLGAYSLIVSSSSTSMDEQTIRDLVSGTYGQDNVARVEQEGLLEPYRAIGVGIGFDGDQQVAVLVYVYDNAEEAEENAATLLKILASGTSLARRVPWNQMTTDVNVEVHGPAIHARLYTKGPMIAVSAWNDLDTLVLTK
jgi:hypothetical protein